MKENLDFHLCTGALDNSKQVDLRSPTLVDQRFFDILGVEASFVKDGILLPWRLEGTRGTIFIISHSRHEALDQEDLHLMMVLANFAAMGIRQHRQQESLRTQATAAAAVAMANDLAHQINNPLQCLTNLLYMTKQSDGAGDEKSLPLKLESDFERLSSLAKNLLELPKKTSLHEGGSRSVS